MAGDGGYDGAAHPARVVCRWTVVSAAVGGAGGPHGG
jgi:hypothetical protein